ELGDLVGVKGGIERDGGVARGDDSEIGGHPARRVVGQNGDAGASTQLLLGHPAADRFGHFASLCEGVALDLVLALDFERYVLRAALLGFNKLIIESGHEGRGKYTCKGAGSRAELYWEDPY